jgi:GDP-mannose 6-dehydrogenase
MRVSIFGLGYVGCVTGACMAEMGQDVIGIDTNDVKVKMINSGRSPIIEKDIDKIIATTVKGGRLRATGRVEEAIQNSDVAMLCVGTPSRENGSLDLTSIELCAGQIGAVLKTTERYFVVVLRSTVLPGTVENVVIPILENRSGKKAGYDFGVCMNPEFLREGSSVYDFYNPPKNVIGEIDSRSGNIVAELYRKIESRIFRVPIRIAEMVKYCDNTFHALKVSYSNEIGNICKKLGIDSHKVMDIFCSDTKLNISSAYLRPGFAFGGSCLPKDLRALTYEARRLDLETPVLNSILVSNKWQVERIVNKLKDFKGQKIGFLGLSFKGGTDDLRESPLVEVIETILGKGYEIKIYDKYVSIARLIGANKKYIEEEIPHISSLIVESIDELIEKTDIIVIGNTTEEFKSIVKKIDKSKTIIDLVRITDDWASIPAAYYGVSW